MYAAPLDKIDPFAGVEAFILAMHLEREGDSLTLRSCEVQSDGIVNRTTYLRTTRLDRAVVGGLARYIAAQLPDLGPDHGVIAQPDAVLRLPGAILQQVRIILATVQDGVQKIVVRFQRVVGTLDRILIGGPALACSSLRDSERLAVQVLSDVAMPLLNLAQSTALVSSMATSNVRVWLDSLARNAHDIQFRMELMKRMIASGTAPPPILRATPVAALAH